MNQQVKVLDAKSDNLHSIPKTDLCGRRTEQTSASEPLTSLIHWDVCTSTSNKQIIKVKKPCC